MGKIPVGATIGEAYRFAVRDFVRLAGVAWLPLLILWVPGLLLRRHSLMVTAADGPAAIQRMIPWLLLLYASAFVLMSMQFIGMARLALGQRRGPAWYYFSLGRPVWRFIANLLLMALTLFLAFLAAAFCSGLLVGAQRVITALVTARPVATGLHLVVFAGMVALWLALAFLAIRLAYLLLPIVAAEEPGFALARSWTLGRRNFWRMFVVLVASILPLLILEGVLFIWLFHGVTFPAVGDAAQAAMFQAAIHARVAGLAAFSTRAWYLVCPMGAAVVIFCYGVIVGGQCFAWRALARNAAQPQIDQQTLPG